MEVCGPIVLNFGQEENKNNAIIHGRAVSASSNQTVMDSQIAISMLDWPPAEVKEYPPGAKRPLLSCFSAHGTYVR
jgi:hypothetical protein